MYTLTLHNFSRNAVIYIKRHFKKDMQSYICI